MITDPSKAAPGNQSSSVKKIAEFDLATCQGKSHVNCAIPTATSQPGHPPIGESLPKSVFLRWLQIIALPGARRRSAPLEGCHRWTSARIRYNPQCLLPLSATFNPFPLCLQITALPGATRRPPPHCNGFTSTRSTPIATGFWHPNALSRFHPAPQALQLEKRFFLCVYCDLSKRQVSHLLIL
jgi:hypothetical protein